MATRAANASHKSSYEEAGSSPTICTIVHFVETKTRSPLNAFYNYATARPHFIFQVSFWPVAAPPTAATGSVISALMVSAVCALDSNLPSRSKPASSVVQWAWVRAVTLWGPEHGPSRCLIFLQGLSTVPSFAMQSIGHVFSRLVAKPTLLDLIRGSPLQRYRIPSFVFSGRSANSGFSLEDWRPSIR